MVKFANLPTILATTILTMAISCSALAETTGTLELSSENLIKMKGYYCGFVSSKWIPGRRLAGSLFYSHTSERGDVLRAAQAATGKKRTQLLKKAQQLVSLRKTRTKSCQKVASLRVDGDWAGSTNQGGAVSFTIARSALMTLSATLRVDGHYCSSEVTITVDFDGALAVKNQKFAYSSSDFIVSGTFSDGTKAAGKVTYIDSYCEGRASTSWHANRVSQ